MMRPPFKVEINDPSINPGNNLVWRELTATPLKLSVFFDEVHRDKVLKLWDADGRKADDSAYNNVVIHSLGVSMFDGQWSLSTQQNDYEREAADILFSLRDFKGLGINHVLPAASIIAPIVRNKQEPHDLPKGTLGLHVGVLWDEPKHKIVGVSTLQRQGETSEAELAYWQGPTLKRAQFLGAVKAFMDWSTKPENAGFTDFKAHVPTALNGQRGNPASVDFAMDLGFAINGIRPADAKEAKAARGKSAYVLTAKADGWHL